MTNPLADAERILSATDIASMERKIEAYGEVLPLLAEALRELTERVRRLEGGEPPPGRPARY